MRYSGELKHFETEGKIIRGILRCALLAYAGTREGASVTKAISGNVLSYLDRLSVHIVFGGIIGLSVNISFWHIPDDKLEWVTKTNQAQKSIGETY